MQEPETVTVLTLFHSDPEMFYFLIISPFYSFLFIPFGSFIFPSFNSTHTMSLMGLAASIWQAKGDWQLLLLDQRLLVGCGLANVAVLFCKINSMNFDTLASVSRLII